MAAEIILTKVDTTTCDSVNDTFHDDTFVIDESIDDDKEKDRSREIIADLVDNIVTSSKEDDDTTPPVDQEEERKEVRNTEMNTSCAQNCNESLPIPTTSCTEEKVPLTSSTPPPLPTETNTTSAVVSDDEPSPIQQNETNETIDIGDIISPLEVSSDDCTKDEKVLADNHTDEGNNSTSDAKEEIVASYANNNDALQSNEQDNSSLQNQETTQPLSNLNLETPRTATDSSTASSVILSDSGESKCTLTSTLPVINLTISGKEHHDEKLVALGVFVKPANGDGNEDTTDKVDEDAGKGSSLVQSTADDGDAPVDETVDNKDTERSESINTNEQEAASATIPSALSPTSLTSTSSSILLDKKRLSERLKQRLAKRNSDSTTGDGPLIPTTKPPPKRDTARDREQWETRLRAASRQKRASKTRAKSIDDNNSDILSRYSGSEEIDIGGSRKVYPDTVTFSDGEDDNDVNDASSKTVVNRRTAYRKCVSEVGVSSLRPTQSPTKLSKHHHSHHHGIGILQSDGIVYDDALLLRLARQARFGQGRGEASTNALSAASSEAKGGVDSRANEVKIHVYDLLAKDSLVEVPYLGCNFPIGQCFKTLNDGCHKLGTGAYHVGVEINGVEYAFGANNIIGMSGIFTCVPKESPGYEFRETLDFGNLHTTKRTWIRIPKSGKGATFQNISKAFSGSIDTQDEKKSPESPANGAPSKDMNHLYSFREIESFADGHSIVHSLAREYMGTDYDLLRKNCCTFARDLCIRLGVKEEVIPSWFHNAAQAGANAEDAITTAENNMRRLVDCNQVGGDPLDGENKDHGFEVLIDGEMLKVVESPTMRTPGIWRPLSDCGSESIYETSSWY